MTVPFGIIAVVLLGVAAAGWYLLRRMPKGTRELNLVQAVRATRRVLRSNGLTVRRDAQDLFAIVDEADKVRVWIYSEDHRLSAALLTDLERFQRAGIRVVVVLAYFAPHHIVADAKGRGFHLVSATNLDTFPAAIQATLYQLGSGLVAAPGQ